MLLDSPPNGGQPLPSPLGWPRPPYRPPVGCFDDIMEAQGYLALPNPYSDRGTQELVTEWLVRIQATHRVAMREVVLADRSPGLLVADRAVWPCP